jgi:hypothetical protein
MSAFDKLRLRKPIPTPDKADSEPVKTPSRAPDGSGKSEHAESAHIIAAQKIPAHGLRTKRLHGFDIPQVSAARVRGHLEPYKAPARDEKGRLLPGQTGNPHGRPIGFVEYIRAMTDDGKELIDHALLCMRGTVMVRFDDPVTGEWTEKEMPADPRYQAEARVFLKESGYGKALATLELKQAEDNGPDYSVLDVAETRDLLRLMAKAESPTKGDSLQRVSTVSAPTFTPELPHHTDPTHGISRGY